MKRPPIFQIFRSERGTQPWRFRLTSGNGEIVCQSEGYATRSNAVRASRRLPAIALAALEAAKSK